MLPVEESISDDVFYTNFNTPLGIRMGAKIKKNAKKSLIRGGAFLAHPPRTPPLPLFPHHSGVETKSVPILMI